ncbi:helix-turn-helix domain-containing protein [Pseudonocardia kongjuensis]|uniref:Helix-turn-helix domain-containing protein n=1 Tax=Pseudonocardia kongjuensis TaxID=102227 RepID=A0ABN1XN14_9PSEU
MEPVVIAEGDERPAAAGIIARLLHLLAAEAPGAEFDRLTGSLEDAAAGPPEHDRDELLVAIGRAGRVRELLAHRKRREKETLALIEIARDLASLRDVDEVLEAIVHRARQLLGTDTTYLALRDDEIGDVYMRITLGTVTRAIESIRQPLGTGAGGRIIATGELFATSDYLNDPRLQRDPSVTDAVIEDGIVSMIGVPVRVGSDVIGALFVANRHERTFDPSEVDLLTSLADYASVVIGNARLFEQAEATARRLRAANEELAHQGELLERAGTAHEQLMPLALRRADIGELAETVAGMLDGTVVAVGSDGAVLAVAGAAPVPDPLPAPRPGALGAQRAAPGVWTVPVRAGAEDYGHLVLLTPASDPPDRPDLPEPDVRTLERAAQTAALLLLMERQVWRAEQQVRGELIDDLLAEREPDWTAFERRARRSGGIDFAVPHTVVVLASAEAGRRSLVLAAAEHAARHGGLALEHASRVVLLLPQADPAEVARRLPAELARATGGPVTAGVAGPATSARAVRTGHHEARRCLRLLLALGRDGEGTTRDGLGALGLVLDGSSQRQLRSLLEETIRPLERYDEEHNAMLVATLESYYDNGENPRSAARALQVHPNTVYQRLDRIDRVLGGSHWRDPDGALAMQVALQLRRVLDRIPVEELLPAPG